MTVRRAAVYLALEGVLCVVMLVWINGPIVPLMLYSVLMLLVGRHTHMLNLLQQYPADERTRAASVSEHPDTNDGLI